MSSAEQAAGLMAASSVLAAGAIWGGVALSEHRRRLRPEPSASLALTFPMATQGHAAASAILALSGMRGVQLMFEVRATAEGIRHYVRVPLARVADAQAHLESAVPGLRADEEVPDRLPRGVRRGRRVVVPRRVVLRSGDGEIAGRMMLASMSRLVGDESLTVRWAVEPRRPSSGQSALDVLWFGYRNVPEPPAAWTRKIDDHGFGVEGQLMASAPTAQRAAQLVEQAVSVLRTRGTSNGALRAVRRGGNGDPRVRSASGWVSVGELLPLTGWPLGSGVPEGVKLGAARQLRAGRDVPRFGRPLLMSRGASGERPVALNRAAMLRHVLIAGGTGSGKSSLMVGCALNDFAAGYGGCIIDPKADFASDFVARVGLDQAHRVAVIDPAREDGLVGLDLLGGGDPDLRADVVLGALKRVFADNWGPRSDAYLRSGLRLLAEDRGASLADWPRIYDDAGYRRLLVSRLTDPIQRAEWDAFEGLSPADRANQIAAPLSKVTSIISRPKVRAVLAQPSPKLDTARHMERGGWVIVSISPGPIGEPAAHLIGSLALYAVWNVIEARAAIPREKRRPLGVYIDELTSLSAPFGIETMFERARSLGGALTVATQAIARLPEHTRAALVANAGSLVAFGAGADEAARLARELPGVSPQDLMSLGQYEVAARVSLGTGREARVVTGRTEPMPAETGAEAIVRERSAAQFARSLSEIQALIEERYGTKNESDEAPKVGRARRRA